VGCHEQVFRVGPHSLEIDIEDIYFMIGLSKRGEPIILSGSRGTGRTTDSYVSDFFRAGSHKTGGKIAIKEIADHPLHTIYFTITKLEEALVPTSFPTHICLMQLSAWNPRFSTGVVVC
jgi:hypothetical protein